MSESAGPSSSRTAIANAFKRARRRFPKNFGLNSKTENRNDSEIEDQRFERQPSQDLPKINDIYEKKAVQYVESSLADSLEGMQISEKPEIIYDQCDHSYNIISNEDICIPENKEKIQDYSQVTEQELSEDFHENANESQINLDPTDYKFYEAHQSYGVIWKNQLDICDHIDSEIGEEKIIEMPQTEFYESRESRRKKRPSYEKNSESSNHHHHYCRSSHNSCENEQLLHSPDCPYFNNCIHCQHCNRHCCCRSHCCHCCIRSCLNCRQNICTNNSTRLRRPRKKKCFSCKKRSERRMNDTCSRDSGIFTNIRYENEDFNDADEDDDSIRDIELTHKDSLSILQEKFSLKRKSDEDEYNHKGHNRTCRRVFSRFSN